MGTSKLGWKSVRIVRNHFSQNLAGRRAMCEVTENGPNRFPKGYGSMPGTSLRMRNSDSFLHRFWLNYSAL